MNRSRRPRTAVVIAALALCVACVEVPKNSEQAASFSSTNADVHTRIASAALERGSLEPARASAREALRVDPGRVDAARILARADLLAGETRLALYAAKRATSLAPDDAETWLLLADCAAAAEDSQQRDLALARAAELGSSEARFVRAFQALTAGDARACDELLADPAMARAALGLVVDHLSIESRLEDALGLVEAAQAKAPDPALALTANRLRLALAGKRPAAESGAEPAATDPFASAVTVRDSSEQVLLAAAGDLASRRFTAAADRYRSLLVTEPTNVEVRLALAEALLSAGDRDGALASYRAALAIDSQTLCAIHGIARIEIEDCKFDDALDLLERARNRHPRDPATLALIVVAARRSGRGERAQIDAERLAELDPGGPFDLACRRMLARLEAPETPPAAGGP